ncbi:uncharacterized protein ABDE67_009464 [Symphorus nematophorus]
MDRTVLLVLLCLQVFLLITAFTSTDATTVWRDDQQQQSPYLVEEISVKPSGTSAIRGMFRDTGHRPGAAGVLEEISVNPRRTRGRKWRFPDCNRRPDLYMPRPPALEKDTGVTEVEENSVNPRGTSGRRGMFHDISHQPGVAGEAGQSDPGIYESSGMAGQPDPEI